MMITHSGSFEAAWANGPGASDQAVGEAIARLGAVRPRLVLYFSDATRPAGGTLARAHGAPVVGMSAMRVLTGDGLRHRSCAAMAFGGDDVRAGVGVAEHASRDLRGAGAAAAEAAVAGLELSRGRSVVLLFLDPRSGVQGEAIDGAYEVVGGRIPLAGGGANGADPTVHVDGREFRDVVVAVAIGCASGVEVASAHGCAPCGVPAVVTRAEGRHVMELDGRPAESVYLELIGRAGAELDDREFEGLAVLHPLAQPELRGTVRLRHVAGRAPGGGLACVTPIPANAAVWMAEQTESTIVRSAAGAVEAVVEGLPGPPKAALIFDCAARERALGARAAEEADVLVSAFGQTPAVAGLFTRGEVGRTRGSKGDLNHAVVVVGFG